MSRGLVTESFPHIGQVRVLQQPVKTYSLETQAQCKTLMTELCRLVQPVMAKYKWKVKVVREFYPRNDRLLGLNVNGGQEIKVRMRKPHDPNALFERNHVLGTLLHELVHCDIAPHNDKFYALLDELWGLTQQLMARGSIPMQGEGQRLGGARKPASTREGRRRAAEALEKRLKQQRAYGTGAGGRRLGGDGVFRRKFKSPAEAARHAALRRAADAVWCASNQAGEGKDETPHIVIDDGDDDGDADGDDDVTEKEVAGQHRHASTSTRQNGSGVVERVNLADTPSPHTTRRRSQRILHNGNQIDVRSNQTDTRSPGSGSGDRIDITTKRSKCNTPHVIVLD